jgi:hypothetical protein
LQALRYVSRCHYGWRWKQIDSSPHKILFFRYFSMLAVANAESRGKNCHAQNFFHRFVAEFSVQIIFSAGAKRLVT